MEEDEAPASPIELDSTLKSFLEQQAALFPLITSEFESDIDAMLAVLNHQKLAQPVTIPIRAMLLPSSYDGIIRLMRGAKNDTSLTVCCNPMDRPDTKSVKRLLKEVGNKKVYLDMPRSMIDEIGSPVIA